MKASTLALWATLGHVAWAWLGDAPLARAGTCPRLPAELRCEPLPDEDLSRREALRALDVAGREAVSRGAFGEAATAFGCLVEGDPTPESAGNLAVVLREQGALGDALLIARCAEELAVPGPVLERARVRRREMELRLGLPTDVVPVAVPVPGPATIGATALAPTVPTVVEAPAPRSARSRVDRRWSTAGLGIGAAVLLGSGILNAVARDRAQNFDQEQLTNGYTQQARSLRADARSLEVWSWVGASLGLASLATGGVLLVF
jgi:hypothetical protein